jgi:hypothetical protein
MAGRYFPKMIKIVTPMTIMIAIKLFSANNDDDNAKAKISLIAVIPAIASNPADILRKPRAILIH